MRGAIVVQLVFKEGDFGVEEDRVWFGEFGEGDGVGGVVRIGVGPDVCVGGGVVAGIGRRVCPVVWFCGDGGGEGETRTGICAGETALRGRAGSVLERASPALEPRVGIAHFDTAVAVAELARPDGSECALGVEGERPPGRTVCEGEVVVAKGHLGEGEPECSLEGLALGRVGDGVGRCGDQPAVHLDRARVGGL